MDRNMVIGLELARARLRNGHSVAELARMVEICPAVIERIETGEIEGLYMEIVSLALVLDVDLNVLFGEPTAQDALDAKKTFAVAQQMSRILSG